MPIPHPSFLFRESTEPPKIPLPLEARRVHFHCMPSVSSRPNLTGYLVEDGGRWTADNRGGELIHASYALRHDMIYGGRRAQTALETRIDMYVQNMMEKEEKLKGWWPRVENFRGRGHCFDVVFLRPNMFGCTVEVTVAAGSPDLNKVRWDPEPGTERWDLLPESEMASEELQQQGDEAPEPMHALAEPMSALPESAPALAEPIFAHIEPMPALAEPVPPLAEPVPPLTEPVPSLEESLENGDSFAGDITSDDDFDYMSSAARIRLYERWVRSTQAWEYL